MKEYVVCIKNDHWFGTKGNTYEVIAEGTRVLKDIRFEGDNTLLEFIEVKDDYGQLVEIEKSNFMRVTTS